MCFSQGECSGVTTQDGFRFWHCTFMSPSSRICAVPTSAKARLPFCSALVSAQVPCPPLSLSFCTGVLILPNKHSCPRSHLPRPTFPILTVTTQVLLAVCQALTLWVRVVPALCINSHRACLAEVWRLTVSESQFPYL